MIEPDRAALMDRHLARLRARHPIDAQEERAIRDIVSDYRVVPGQTIVIRDNVRLDHSTILLDGWMARTKALRTGERVISEVHVAGDFPDLHSFTLKRLEHEVLAISPCVVGVVPHEALRTLVESYPRLGRIYWFSTNLDASVHREWELSLARRSADQRLAAFLCELKLRLGLVGLDDGDGYALPMTQQMMADCLGLTNVHLNRMLRQIRERGLASFSRGRATILDWQGLVTLADFTDSYLYLKPDDL